MKKFSFLLLVLWAGQPWNHLYGQSTSDNATPKADLFTAAYHHIFLILAVLVLLGVIFASLNLIWALIDVQRMKLLDKYGPQVLDQAKLGAGTSFWQQLSEKSWRLVPIEKEADIDLGHEFDGIRELDNSLPPWWLWLFYGTILWSAVYLWYYHVSDRGPGMEQEYVAAMQLGEREKEQFLASQADAIDEKTVTLLTEAADLAAGKEIYIANCQVCHGASGEGGVGPNFVDKYWIHGGSVGQIFSTIKYGVPEKGMISWKAQLRPAAMQKVASYILSLQGTNPPNQKAPQGDLVADQATTSTSAVPDSTVVDPGTKKQ